MNCYKALDIWHHSLLVHSWISMLEVKCSNSWERTQLIRTKIILKGEQFVCNYGEGEKDQGDEKNKAIVVGPWGGNGGNNWDDGSYDGVREITLKYGRCIDSICAVYDKNDKPVSGEKHGGSGGGSTAEIKLQFPEEFLTTVSGHYSPVARGGTPVIRSLMFKSNRRSFGPYGVEEGTPFSFPMEGGKIVGFKGRSGWYLDSIGFHISRLKTAKVMQKVQQRFRRLTSSLPLAVPKDSDQTRVKVMKAPA